MKSQMTGTPIPFSVKVTDRPLNRLRRHTTIKTPAKSTGYDTENSISTNNTYKYSFLIFFFSKIIYVSREIMNRKY